MNNLFLEVNLSSEKVTKNPIDESELNFLGIIESVDDIFEASDLELFTKK